MSAVVGVWRENFIALALDGRDRGHIIRVQGTDLSEHLQGIAVNAIVIADEGLMECEDRFDLWDKVTEVREYIAEKSSEGKSSDEKSNGLKISLTRFRELSFENCYSAEKTAVIEIPKPIIKQKYGKALHSTTKKTYTIKIGFPLTDLMRADHLRTAIDSEIKRFSILKKGNLLKRIEELGKGFGMDAGGYFLQVSLSVAKASPIVKEELKVLAIQITPPVSPTSPTSLRSPTSSASNFSSILSGSNSSSISSSSNSNSSSSSSSSVNFSPSSSSIPRFSAHHLKPGTKK